MFGIGKSNLSSYITPIYLLLFILITNHFLFVHSYVFILNDQDQNQLDNLQQAVARQLIFHSLTNPEDSSSDDNDLQILLKPTIQRRFCCMSPLSGRKRFIRDLARQQQVSEVFIQ